MTHHNVDTYLDTVSRLEPDIHPIDAGGGYASMAVSLKRIADSLEFFQELSKGLLLASLDGDGEAGLLVLAQKLRLVK